MRGSDPDRPDDVTTVRGQVEVATTPGLVESVELVPADPPACPEAVEAVHAADWVVLGPGSWFTSVLPHLLVPELQRPSTTTGARRCVTLNLAPQPGETEGFSASTLSRSVGTCMRRTCSIDVVLADPTGSRTSRCSRQTVDGLGADW